MQKILVVDDAAINRDLLYEMLKSDYQVELAEDGGEALAKLQREWKEIAAVLLDLHMPGMDGFQVIQDIRRRGLIRKIPVLVITSEDTAEAESRCLELGVSDFIHKPFERTVIRSRVRKAMGLFSHRNRLEQTVEKQAEALKKQDHIIQVQEEKLKAEKAFERLNKYFHVEVNSITNQGNFLGTLILFKDITQHIEDMNTIKANQNLLIERERLASLGQMIGGIAHNLKTPIMSISGAAEGLTDLVKEYDIHPISTPEADLKEILSR